MRKADSKKRIAKSILISVFVLLQVVVIVSIAQACTFVAAVRDPSIPFEQTGYENFMNYMATTAYADQTNAGFSVHWFHGTPPTLHTPVTRFNTNVEAWVAPAPGSPSAEYIAAYRAARTDNGTLVIGHSRKSTNLPNENDPHPFVYSNIFGKSYTFIHNGTLNKPTLEDYMSPGFCALDIFRTRPYAEWNMAPGIDSEHYAMLLMKYLLVMNNYYWNGTGIVPSITPPGNIASPTEWAIRRVAQNYTIDASNNSLNGILSDGTEAWAIAKSDGVFPHTVGYRDDAATFRKIASASAGNQIYTALPHAGNGTVLCMTYNNTLTPHTMEGTFTDPRELRINETANSTGDQSEPAISVSSDGSFVAVWVSGNVVKARWYNQMGLAEGNEFTVSNTYTAFKKGSPAIAHSPDGNTIKVVWIEGSAGSNYFSVLKSRAFTWNSTTHLWTGATEVTEATNSETSGDLILHPTIAYSTSSGGYAMAWEHTILGGTGGYHHEIHVKATVPGGTNIPEQCIVPYSGFASDYEPDIAYIGNGNYAVAFYGQSGSTSNMKVGIIREALTPSVTYALYAGTSGSHPSIARLNDTQFLLASNKGTVHIDRVTIQANNYYITTDQPINGETLTGNTRVEIATRGTDGTYYVCYDKTSAANGKEIYCARGLGTAVPVIETGSVNLYPTSDQTAPAMAIAMNYNTFYANHHGANNNYFTIRRMIVWQSSGQDGNGLAIAGQFRGIKAADNSLRQWWQSDPFPVPPGALDDFAGNSDENSGNTTTEPTLAPARFELAAAYPNPFNPTTTLHYNVPEAAQVRLDVFDINGRLITTLLDNYTPAGSYSVSFNGADLSTGTYFVRMQAGSFQAIRKLLLVK